MNIKRRIISLIAFTLTMIIVWLVIQNKNQVAKYWDYGINIPTKYNLLGMDVSHHQGDIFWEDVDKMSIEGDSISFVFVKATEGSELIDDRFIRNAESLDKNAIPFGAYHYFYPSKSAKEQAEFFVGQIKEAKFDLKPVLDIEMIGDLSNEQIADSILIFLNFVEQELEARPIIYTYESFYKDYLDGTGVQNELYWIASYNESCALFSKENFIAWQFCETGTVNGISTKVDLNVAKKSFFENALK